MHMYSIQCTCVGVRELESPEPAGWDSDEPQISDGCERLAHLVSHLFSHGKLSMLSSRYRCIFPSEARFLLGESVEIFMVS